jgi:ATP-dependent Lon protease
MRDFRDAKLMAQTLREALSARNISITHSECLEVIAKQFGLADWNTLSATIQVGSSPALHDISASRKAARKPLTSGMILPVVPLRDVVVFPQMAMALFLGREKSIRAAEHATSADSRLMLIVQRNPDDEDPSIAELYPMGVVATLLQSTKVSPGNMVTWVQGERRATLQRLLSKAEFTEAEIAPVTVDRGEDAETRTLARQMHQEFLSYAKAARRPTWFLPPPDNEPGNLADAVAAYLLGGIAEKQALLETTRVTRRLEIILEIISRGKAAA